MIYTDDYGQQYPVQNIHSFVFYKGMMLTNTVQDSASAYIGSQIINWNVSVPSISSEYCDLEGLSPDEAAKESVEISTDAEIAARLILVKPSTFLHEDGSVDLGFLMAPVGRSLRAAESIMNSPLNSSMSTELVSWLVPDTGILGSTQSSLLSSLDKEMNNTLLASADQEDEDEGAGDTPLQMIFSWEDSELHE